MSKTRNRVNGGIHHWLLIVGLALLGPDAATAQEDLSAQSPPPAECESRPWMHRSQANCVEFVGKFCGNPPAGVFNQVNFTSCQCQFTCAPRYTPIAQSSTVVHLRGTVTSSNEIDYILFGRSYNYTPFNSFIDVEPMYNNDYRQGVRISVNSLKHGYNPEYWDIELSQPRDSGKLLERGTYSGATRFPFNSRSAPGFDISGSHRGCNELRATFTIHDIHFCSNSKLERLSLSFAQWCENFVDVPSTGSVYYFSNEPCRRTVPPRRLARETAQKPSKGKKKRSR